MPPPSEAFTLACRHGDFSDWHRGRRRYGVWAIAADTPAITATVDNLQARLAPWLLPDYRRQPHITVALGGFPAITRGWADDYSATCFATQVATLEQRAPAPLTLELGPCNTFTSAPYLSVGGDTNELLQLRQALLDSHPEADSSAYTPHLTLGLYGGTYPLPSMRAHLNELSPRQNQVLEVRYLALMTYAAATIGGPLETVARFDLQQRRLEADPTVLDALFTQL
ncbi:MAG TPA: 2'-5' RNA ligase family protein [Azospira sp.]|nr:2'-5' RNA ligase family protein [Azospira sp.]